MTPYMKTFLLAALGLVFASGALLAFLDWAVPVITGTGL